MSTSSAQWVARAAIHSPFTPRGLPRLEVRSSTLDEKVYTAAPLTEQERNFRVAALELKRMAFIDLRDAIEGREPRFARRTGAPVESGGSRSSWDAPFIYVQLEYPLDDNVQYSPPQQLEDEAEALWWLSGVLNEEWGTKNRAVTALQIMTRLAAFVRRHGKVNPVIPLAFWNIYREMDDAGRADFLQQWFSPVSHGDRYIDAPVAHGFPYNEKDGRALPDEDPSLVVESGERYLTAAAVFEVYPLMLDLDAGRAFYTLKAGLPWAGSMESPATWTERQQKTLWSALFQSLELLEDFYRGKVERLPDAVEVTLESVPEIDAPLHSPEASDWRASERLVSEEEAEATLQPLTELVARTGRAGGSKVFPLPFGNTYADAAALDFVQHIHQLRLPRSWLKLKRWTDLVDDEVREYLETMGQGATVDPRPTTGNAYTYPKLERVSLAGKPMAEWPWRLSREAERELRWREGARGFLDLDPRGREAVYRCIKDNKGNLIEVWLSWNGLASPLFRDRLAKSRQEVWAEWPDTDQKNPLLFDDLDDELKRKLTRQLERLNIYEHGRSIMEALLGQVGRQRHNPVEVPAEALRRLLWPSGNWPNDWKETVNRTLGGLMGLTTSWRAGKLTGEAAFVGSWEYRPLGHGGHGEGYYVVSVTDQFVRSLAVFEEGGMTLRSGAEAVVYKFRDLERGERKGLNFVAFDAGRTFYHAAAGLTPQQRNIANWLEREITRNRDTPARGTEARKAKPSSTSANEPRLYEHNFCPLLPEGASFVGALGHFSRNAEAGRTLFGTASRPGRTDGKSYGAHSDGLVAVAGYPLPPGRAHAERADVVRKTLEDLKAVVVDYLGGCIVGKLTERQRKDGGTGAQWLHLEEFMTVDEETLCRTLKLYFFLPPDWNERRRETFRKVTGYEITESVEEAEAAAYGMSAPTVETAPPPAKAAPVAAPTPAKGATLKGAADGWRGYGPLPNRLYAALQAKKMERQELARIFGVTKSLVSQWLFGMKLGQDPALAKRIPEDLGALMVRWLETGQEPTPEELGALVSRKRSPALRGRT